MTTPPPDQKPGFLERLSSLLAREPEDREQLLHLLRSAHQRQLLDADALGIIEGALAASEMTVREAMVPRPQMEIVDIEDSFTEVVAKARTTAHSRLPVIKRDRDHVVGILLAKDLLHAYGKDAFDWRDYVRPAAFVPEFKRLDVLLRDFRASRNHLALVIDEYAGIAGLITIEDVLEQIVGEIEDEHDLDEADDDIVLEASGSYRVKAQTPVNDLNTTLGTRFSDDKCQTVGGLVLFHAGCVPQVDEALVIDGIHFQVLRADSRRLHTLVVSRPPEAGDQG